MKVDLYLKNINQEMIDAGRGARRGADLAWVVSWPKECCIIDFSLAPPDEQVSDPPLVRGFILRKEDEGGMFWDPSTSAVYRVDEEAYHTMLELDRGLSAQAVARRMRVPVRKVSKLREQLQRIASKSLKRGASGQGRGRASKA